MAPKSTSRFLSLILRHRPETVGLQLDRHGWVMVDELLRALAAHGRATTRPELEQIVRDNNKQRFAFSADGRRIRANQGHSVDVDLALEPQQPPSVLYHGTAERFLPAIRREGLKRMSRHHVHLSPDRDTAVQVGSRHGRVVMLTVAAGQMDAAGHAFYRSANGVWLTEAVPVAYIDFEAV